MHIDRAANTPGAAKFTLKVLIVSAETYSSGGSVDPCIKDATRSPTTIPKLTAVP